MDIFFSSLFEVLEPQTFGLMLLGIAIGFAVGILPGLGGAVTLALMLPFVYAMSPVAAFAFLLGMHAVTATTGDITSVLFGIPGEATAAATVLDGHPMAKRGEAGRALGAVLFSSLIGAVFGAFVLAASVPIIRPVVLAFGPPEFLLLTVLGLSFIISLAGKNILKGFIMAGFGFLLAMVGLDPQAGIPRYTMGQLYLWEGIGIVPVVVGLFGGAEVLQLMMTKSSIARQRGHENRTHPKSVPVSGSAGSIGPPAGSTEAVRDWSHGASRMQVGYAHEEGAQAKAVDMADAQLDRERQVALPARSTDQTSASLRGTHEERITGVMQGVRDTLAHWWLTLRASTIGVVIGIIPGMGGAVAQFIAYAHAQQTSKHPETFGTGNVEGVLAAGAVNNSKEGGSLIPTVAFGIPGSTSMAILLSAFLVTGLVPGPDMLTKHLNITYSMVWVIVLSNVIAVALSFLCLQQLAKITYLKGTLLVPFLLVLIALGAYTTHNSFGDIIVMLAATAVGVGALRWDWPRAPLLLALVLGETAERYLFLSHSLYGWSWLGRPLVIALALVTLLGIFWPLLARRSRVRPVAVSPTPAPLEASRAG